MSTLEAIFLGMVQGITEFFPVSSSGHLELGQFLLGLRNLETYVFFNLICHLGTLLAILVVFKKEIRRILSSDQTSVIQILLGTLPLFLLVPVMKSVKAIFDKPEYLGFCFLATAALLYAGLSFHPQPLPPETLQKRRWRDSIVIGLFQLVAILPGISRSGATISAGWLLGWNREKAVTFSFMLAIPTILGGATYELLSFLRSSGTEIAPIHLTQYLAGFLTSFGFGYMSLLLVIRLAIKERFRYFVWYCLLLGVFTIGYFTWIQP